MNVNPLYHKEAYFMQSKIDVLPAMKLDKPPKTL